MHRVRRAVRENALTDPARVTEAAYLPFVAAGSAWVALDGAGAVAGFAALDRGEAGVWALFVAPGREGAGIGRALLDTLVDDAARRGLRALWLTTATGTRAEHFYRRAGWTPVPGARPGKTRFERHLRD